MNLDVGIGIGEHGEFTPVLRGDVEVDVFRPRVKVGNFVQADAGQLPFSDACFEKVFAYNVLEHVPNPWKALAELRRVGKTVEIRQDKWYFLGSYATSSHLWLQLPGPRFLRFPRTLVGIGFAKWLRRVLEFRIRWGRERYFSLPWSNFFLQERFRDLYIFEGISKPA